MLIVAFQIGCGSFLHDQPAPRLRRSAEALRAKAEDTKDTEQEHEVFP
jgi:hypothetical protein